MKLFLRV